MNYRILCLSRFAFSLCRLHILFLKCSKLYFRPLSRALASHSAVSCRLKLMLSLPNWTTSHWSIEMSWRLAMTLRSPRENRGRLGHYLSPQKCVSASSSSSAGKGQAWNAPTVIIQHTQCSPIPSANAKSSVSSSPLLALSPHSLLPHLSLSTRSSFGAGFCLSHGGNKSKRFTTEYISSPITGWVNKLSY